MKHDNLGRVSVKSESELAEFASAALAKLKEMPDKASFVPVSGDCELFVQTAIELPGLVDPHRKEKFTRSYTGDPVPRSWLVT